MSNPTYSRGGVVLAVMTMLVVGFLVGGATFSGTIPFLSHLEKWQTSIAALIALLAAAIAYTNVQRQIATQKTLALRAEAEALAVIRMEMGDLLDLIAVAWRIVDRAIEHEANTQLWETRVTWARSDLAYHLPPIEVLEDIERLVVQTSALARRPLNKVIARLKVYFRESTNIESTPPSQENRILQFGRHKLLLLRIQLSLIAQAVEEWDVNEAQRFNGLTRAPLDNRTWAQQLEEQRQQAIGMEAEN